LVPRFIEIAEGTVTNQTVGDSNYQTTTFPTSATNFEVFVNFLPEKFGAITSLSSSDPSVLQQSASNPFLFEYQSSGRAAITVRFNTNEQAAKKAIATTFENPTIENEFISFVEGSLSRHIFDQIRNYADGSTASPSHYPLYSTFNNITNQYVKNTGSWANQLDWTGVSVNKTNDGGGSGNMVAAITPYHAIGVRHFLPAANDVFYFCDSNNQTVARTASSVGFLQGPNNEYVDCCIVAFSEPLPSTVKKYKTLPSTFDNYFPNNINNKSIDLLPFVVTSHYRWDAGWPLQRFGRFAYVYQTDGKRDGTIVKNINYNPAINEPNNFTDYSGVPSGIRAGDSGGPCFFIINGELVLVCGHRSSNSGPIHASFLSLIQSKIDELGPSGQTYETVDLSAFTNFAN